MKLIEIQNQNFKTSKIYLNLRELNFSIKIKEPKVIIRNNKIDLLNLNLFLSLKSLFNKNFPLKQAEVSFKQNDIKDLTKISSLFLPSIINVQLNKIFEKGRLEGEITIPFTKNGKISEDYTFYGKIIDAKINLNKNYKIENLTADIGFAKKSYWPKTERLLDGLEIRNIKGSFLDLKLGKGTSTKNKSSINIKFRKNKKIIKSNLYTSGSLGNNQIKNLLTFLKLKNNLFKDIELKASLMNSISFELDKRFKIKNMQYSSKGKISDLKLILKNSEKINEFLPSL